MSTDDLYIELSNNYDLRLLTSGDTVSLDNLIGWKLVGTLECCGNPINCIFETGSSMWLERFEIAIVTPKSMLSAVKFIFVIPQCPDIYLLEDFSGIFNDVKSDVEKFIRNTLFTTGDLVMQNDGTIITTTPNGYDGYYFTNYTSPIPPFINPVSFSTTTGSWCCNDTNI